MSVGSRCNPGGQPNGQTPACQWEVGDKFLTWLCLWTQLTLYLFHCLCPNIHPPTSAPCPPHPASGCVGLSCPGVNPHQVQSLRCCRRGCPKSVCLPRILLVLLCVPLPMTLLPGASRSQWGVLSFSITSCQDVSPRPVLAAGEDGSSAGEPAQLSPPAPALPCPGPLQPRAAPALDSGGRGEAAGLLGNS